MLKPGHAVQKKSGSGKSADHTTPQRIPGEKNPSIQQSGLAGWRVGVLENSYCLVAGVSRRRGAVDRTRSGR